MVVVMMVVMFSCVIKFGASERSSAGGFDVEFGLAFDLAARISNDDFVISGVAGDDAVEN